MRALRYEGPSKGVVLSRTAPEPELREGEAIVRPLRMAISPMDLALAARRPDIPPITMGREFVGVVEKAKPGGAAGGRASLVGQRVVAASGVPCSSCDLCQRGLATHCRNLSIIGLTGRDGCFADRIAVPIRNLSPVPKEVDDDRAIFAAVVAAALHASQQIRIEGKPYITVLGDGPLALVCGQLMSRLNASVRIVGWRESRADLAAKWGVKHRPERDAGRRADQDIVVDATGTAEGFALALRLVRPRGKVLLAGALPLPLSSAWSLDLGVIGTNEIEILGSRGGLLGEALETIRKGEVDPTSLITRRTRLEDGLEGLRLAAQPESLTVAMEP